MKQNSWVVIDEARNTILDNLQTVGSTGIVYTDLDYTCKCRERVEKALNNLIEILEEANYELLHSEDDISEEVHGVALDYALLTMRDILDVINYKFDGDKQNYFIYTLQFRLSAMIRMFQTEDF